MIYATGEISGLPVVARWDGSFSCSPDVFTEVFLTAAALMDGQKVGHVCGPHSYTDHLDNPVGFTAVCEKVLDKGFVLFSHGQDTFEDLKDAVF